MKELTLFGDKQSEDTVDNNKNIDIVSFQESTLDLRVDATNKKTLTFILLIRFPKTH